MDAATCLERARETGDARWLARLVDAGATFREWTSAARLLRRLGAPARRTARLAVAGTYTTSHFVPLLELAAWRRGLALEVYEAGFDQLEPELLDPGSALHAFAPDFTLLVPHAGAARFPVLAADPEAVLAAERARWQGLIAAAPGRVVMHTFVPRPERVFGHLAPPGAREPLLRRLNAGLTGTLLVDAERVAAEVGLARWFDDRNWFLARQAVGLEALPELARHTAAVLAAAAGLSAKCVVLDLDDTLWGGLIGEDGVAGIELGGTPRGEAHLAFQAYLRALRERGVLLAVVSKNDPETAREPFRAHPDMRLALDDFAVFIAGWADKAAGVREVAARLGIGVDALAFVDDSPAERELVRQLAPEAEVVELPRDPARYVRALDASLLFEPAALTDDDRARAAQYAARARGESARAEAGTLADFYASLDMEAEVAPFDALNLPRVAQLVAKTNQFNLTARRHPPERLEAFAADPGAVTLALRLRDRFGDHGLVAVLIACRRGDVLDIDTWLMSCRVIGRTVEEAMLAALCAQPGVRRLRGTYAPTDRNGLVRDLYPRLGFAPAGEGWEYDVAARGPIRSRFIRVGPPHDDRG